MRKAQPSAPHPRGDARFQAGLVEMDAAGPQGGEAIAVDVDAKDRVTAGRQPGGDDGADVAEADDGDFQRRVPYRISDGCTACSRLWPGIITTRPRL